MLKSNDQTHSILDDNVFALGEAHKKGLSAEVKRLIVKVSKNTRITGGMSLLHLAVCYKDLQIASDLLAAGADKSATNKKGEKPLELAVHYSLSEFINLLFDESEDINAIVNLNSGNTLLHIAAQYGNFEFVKQCLLKGADLSIPNMLGSTPLHLAVEFDYFEIAQWLCDKGADKSATDLKGEKPLELALQYGRSQIINLLFNESEDINAIVNPNTGNTLLHIAAQYGNFKFVEQCLLKGAMLSPTNRHGNTPLHLAIKSHDTKTIECLLKRGADPCSVNFEHITPVYLAVKEESDHIIKCFLDISTDGLELSKLRNHLLDAGIDCGNKKVLQFLLDSMISTEDGSTYLHKAVLVNHISTVKYFINGYFDYSINSPMIDCINKEKKTPIDLAVEYRCFDIVDLLLRYKAKDSSKLNSLDCAIQIGHIRAVNLLIDRGADISAINAKGQTPLHTAVKNDAFNMISLLADRGANMSVRNAQGQTPLQTAVRENCPEIVELLIDRGADTSVLNEKGQTLLDLAVENKHLKITMSLLKKMGNSNDGSHPLHIAVQIAHTGAVQLLLENIPNINVRNHNKKRPIDLAVENGYLDIIKLILNKAIEDIKDGSTPLHYLILGGNVRAAELLIEDKDTDINVRNKQNETPLDLAVKNKQSKIVELILNKKQGATKDPSTAYPLHMAVREIHKDAVICLLDAGADISAVNTEGDTPLHTAVQWGSLQMITLLLDKGANISASNTRGNTPLHRAVQIGSTGSIKLLLDKGADVSAINKRGDTPLHTAVQIGCIFTIKMLLDGGAEISFLNEKGQTPLDLAVENKCISITKSLLNKIGNINDGSHPLHIAVQIGHAGAVQLLLQDFCDINVRNPDKKWPIDLAAEKGHLDIVKLILNEAIKASEDGSPPLHFLIQEGYVRTAKLLIEDKDANIMARNKKDKQPLDLAAENNEVELVKLILNKMQRATNDASTAYPLHMAVRQIHKAAVICLLDAGADISAVNTEGDTPLHTAVQWGSLQMITLLLDKGANISATNTRGNTPLHSAVQLGSIGSMKLLLSRGADISAINTRGDTPLHTAVQIGCIFTVKLLLDKGADIYAVNGDNKTPLELATGDIKTAITVINSAQINENNKNKSPEHRVGFFHRTTNFETLQVQEDQQPVQSSSSSSQFSPG